MGLNFMTLEDQNHRWWPQAWALYWEAFGHNGGKSGEIIQRMFERRQCFVQLLIEEDTVIAMALSGFTHNRQSIIIDYITVNSARRGEGIGLQFVQCIKTWCAEQQVRTIIIEVESEPTAENLARIRFWQKCGFHLTDYVHHYIWVPEPYRAMQAVIDPHSPLCEDGQELFRHITAYHRKAYSKREKGLAGKNVHMMNYRSDEGF